MSDETEPSFADKIAYPALLFAETGTWLDLGGLTQIKPIPFLFDLKVTLSTAYAVRAKLIVNGPGAYVGLTPSGRQVYARVRRWKARR